MVVEQVDLVEPDEDKFQKGNSIPGPEILTSSCKILFQKFS